MSRTPIGNYYPVIGILAILALAAAFILMLKGY